MFADVDNGPDTLPKKIRNGEIAQYNFIFGQSPYPFPWFPLTDGNILTYEHPPNSEPWIHIYLPVFLALQSSARTSSRAGP